MARSISNPPNISLITIRRQSVSLQKDNVSYNIDVFNDFDHLQVCFLIMDLKNGDRIFPNTHSIPLYLLFGTENLILVQDSGRNQRGKTKTSRPSTACDNTFIVSLYLNNNISLQDLTSYPRNYSLVFCKIVRIDAFEFIAGLGSNPDIVINH